MVSLRGPDYEVATTAGPDILQEVQSTVPVSIITDIRESQLVKIAISGPVFSDRIYTKNAGPEVVILKKEKTGQFAYSTSKQPVPCFHIY